LTKTNLLNENFTFCSITFARLNQITLFFSISFAGLNQITIYLPATLMCLAAQHKTEPQAYLITEHGSQIF